MCLYNENGPMTLTEIEAGFTRDVTPASDEVTLRNHNSGGRLKTGFNIAVDRKEEGVIYIGTWYEGIFRFKDGRQTTPSAVKCPRPHVFIYHMLPSDVIE